MFAPAFPHSHSAKGSWEGILVCEPLHVPAALFGTGWQQGKTQVMDAFGGLLSTGYPTG